MIHEHLPASLEVLLGRLDEAPPESREARCWLDESLSLLTTFFASVAASVWLHAEPPSSDVATLLGRPMEREAWRALLRRSLLFLEASHAREPVVVDLARVMDRGRHARWLADGTGPGLEPGSPVASPPDPAPDGVREPALPDLRAVLDDWLQASETFFERWRLRSVHGADGVRTVLRGESGDIDLYPFLQITDCPDCDATAQLFAYDGPADRHRVRCRSLHSGHLCFLPLLPPATRWPRTRPAPLPDAPARAGTRPFPTFAEDDEKVAPEAHLARIRRLVADSDRGYALVYGPDGAGKTYLGRLLASGEWMGSRPVRVAWAAFREGDCSAPSLVLWQLDGALREAGLLDVRLPDPEYARFLTVMGGSPDQQMQTYLSALVRLNGAPLVVMVDDVHLAPHSADSWPARLPEGVFLVLAAQPGALSPELSERLAALAEIGGVRLELTPDDPTYVGLVAQWRARFDAGTPAPVSPTGHTFLEARIRALAEPHDGSRDALALPSKGVTGRRAGVGRFDFIAHVVGRELFTARIVPALLRIAAARGPVPERVASEWIGQDGVHALAHEAGFLLQRHREGNGVALSLAHPALASWMRGAYPEAHREACRQLAWWAAEVLLADEVEPWAIRVAREGLWRWVTESESPVLAARLGQSQALALRLRGDVENLDASRALRDSDLLAAWQQALQPLLQRAVPVVSTEIAMDVSLWRGEHLCRMGAFAEAWQIAQRLVARLAEMVRNGRSGMHGRLASALALRARVALQRNMASSAVEDGTRVVDLRGAGGTAGGDAQALGEARWDLGRALAAEGRVEPALAQMEQALGLLDAGVPPPRLLDLRQDLAGLYLRTGRLDEAETLCDRMLESLDTLGGVGPAESPARATTLAHRALVRGARGRGSEAVRDLRCALKLHLALLDQGRFDLVEATTQVHYDLGVLLARQGTLREASERLTEAIRLHREWSGDHGVLLARAHTERGLVRTRLGEVDPAVEDFSAAIDLGDRLLARDRRSSLRSDLARAHNNRALALSRRGEAGRAAIDFQAAIGHYDALVTRQHRLEFRRHLALVHANLGNLLRASNEPANAAVAHGHAVDLLGRLLGEHPTPDVARELATALASRGLAALTLGQHAGALPDCDRAVDLLVDLLDRGHPVAADLEAVLHTRGRVQAGLGRWHESIQDLTRATDLEHAPRPLPSLGDDLPPQAAVSLERGQAHQALGDFASAARDFKRCIALCEPLDGERAVSLQAAAYTGLGQACLARKATTEAARALDTAIMLHRQVGERLRDRAWHAQTAQAHHARGQLRLRTHGADAALDDLDEAYRAYEAVSRGGDPTVRCETGKISVCIDRCRALLQQRRHERAWAEGARALDLLGRLGAESAESERLLAEALALRGRAAGGLGRTPQAIDHYTRSIAAYSRLADDARDLDMCRELARVYRDRATAQQAVGDTRNAVFDYGWAVDLYRELTTRHGQVELEGEMSAACAGRGLLLLQADRPREALRDLQEAVALGGSHTPAAGRDFAEAIRFCLETLEENRSC